MGELSFDCLDARPEPYAVAPTLVFRLRLAETTGLAVHAIALRCQIRLLPRQRRYTETEAERLYDLFGPVAQWKETLNPLQFTQVSVMVPGFSGATEIDVPVACTYDMEVATARYFHALDDGEIPMEMLFSGTVFHKGGRGFAVEQVPWHKEASYRLPVPVWREMMDRHFPDSTWIRLPRETFDQLARLKSERALPTWEATFEELLAQTKDRQP